MEVAVEAPSLAARGVQPRPVGVAHHHRLPHPQTLTRPVDQKLQHDPDALQRYAQPVRRGGRAGSALLLHPQRQAKLSSPLPVPSRSCAAPQFGPWVALRQISAERDDGATSGSAQYGAGRWMRARRDRGNSSSPRASEQNTETGEEMRPSVRKAGCCVADLVCSSSECRQPCPILSGSHSHLPPTHRPCSPHTPPRPSSEHEGRQLSSGLKRRRAA